MRLDLARRAARDLRLILAESRARFGGFQAAAYKGALDAALARIAAEPTLPASRPRPDLGPDARSPRVAALTPRRDAARHVVFYRVAPGRVLVLRVLHERMDPGRAGGLGGEG